MDGERSVRNVTSESDEEEEDEEEQDGGFLIGQKCKRKILFCN